MKELITNLGERVRGLGERAASLIRRAPSNSPNDRIRLLVDDIKEKMAVPRSIPPPMVVPEIQVGSTEEYNSTNDSQAVEAVIESPATSPPEED